MKLSSQSVKLVATIKLSAKSLHTINSKIHAINILQIRLNQEQKWDGQDHQNLSDAISLWDMSKKVGFSKAYSSICITDSVTNVRC